MEISGVSYTQPRMLKRAKLDLSSAFIQGRNFSNQKYFINISFVDILNVNFAIVCSKPSTFIFECNHYQTPNHIAFASGLTPVYRFSRTFTKPENIPKCLIVGMYIPISNRAMQLVSSGNYK